MKSFGCLEDMMFYGMSILVRIVQVKDFFNHRLADFNGALVEEFSSSCTNLNRNHLRILELSV